MYRIFFDGVNMPLGKWRSKCRFPPIGEDFSARVAEQSGFWAMIGGGDLRAESVSRFSEWRVPRFSVNDVV
ncbi:MAG: hypothetical protein DWH81_00825 [Planctomycetota bacterium]|nr:MAG: hypothetical protein DWH81_00825 [Planctomycetota bacterium]